MISQHWFKKWFDAVRKQVIICVLIHFLCGRIRAWGRRHHTTSDTSARFLNMLAKISIYRDVNGRRRYIYDGWWRHGNIFRVTGPLCKEFTGHRWIPLTKAKTRIFDVFFDLCLNKWLSKNSKRRWFKTPSRSLWRHFDGIISYYLAELFHKCRASIIFRG